MKRKLLISIVFIALLISVNYYRAGRKIHKGEDHVAELAMLDRMQQDADMQSQEYKCHLDEQLNLIQTAKKYGKHTDPSINAIAAAVIGEPRQSTERPQVTIIGDSEPQRVVVFGGPPVTHIVIYTMEQPCGVCSGWTDGKIPMTTVQHALLFGSQEAVQLFLDTGLHQPGFHDLEIYEVKRLLVDVNGRIKP